jgi:hypothetical protein
LIVSSNVTTNIHDGGQKLFPEWDKQRSKSTRKHFGLTFSKQNMYSLMPKDYLDVKLNSKQFKSRFLSSIVYHIVEPNSEEVLPVKR